MDIEARLKTIITQELGIAENLVVPGANVVNDLGADSLDVVELVMAIEDAFKIEISDADVGKMATVKDVIDYVQAHSKVA